MIKIEDTAMDKNFLELYKGIMKKVEEYESKSDDIKVIIELYPKKQYVNDIVEIRLINWKNNKNAAYALDIETFERFVSLNGEKIEGRILNHTLENLLTEVTK